jgi:alanine racemase
MLTEQRACTVLTIHLQKIAANYRKLVELVAPAECAVVIKADAYGLGAEKIAPALWQAGAKTFFVATLMEGIALRKVLKDASIAVLNGLFCGCEKDYIRYRLLPILNHLEEVELWSKASKKASRKLPAFLHIDTGLNRLGMEKREVEKLSQATHLLESIDFQMHLSHFACADSHNHPMIERQAKEFLQLKSLLPAAKASLCNSAGIFCGKEFHHELVRPGAALYGLNSRSSEENPLEQVLSWHGRILQVRELDAGESVGYGAGYIAEKKTKLAIISAGYADGLIRPRENRTFVEIAGQKAAVVGRVSMDLLTIDVTDVPEAHVYRGAIVKLLNENLTIDSMAKSCNAISHELLVSLGKRCLRQYL